MILNDLKKLLDYAVLSDIPFDYDIESIKTIKINEIVEDVSIIIRKDNDIYKLSSKCKVRDFITEKKDD